MGQLKALKSCPPFQELQPTELAALSLVVEFRQFGPGETVMRAGESGNTMWVVTRGKVELTLPSEQGALLTLGAGDVVGEMALLGSTRHFVTATTGREGASCIGLSRGGLERLLTCRAEVAAKIISAIGRSMAGKAEAAAANS